MEQHLAPYKVVKIVGKKVFVFAHHPDDGILGCGGAIMRYVDASDLLRFIILSNDEYHAGNDKQQLTCSEFGLGESDKAARILGYG